MTIAPGHTSPNLAAPSNGDASAILVVDDSPLNLKAVVAALEDMCDDIVTAESGTEALRLLLQRDFVVVLLDVSMPDMDGYETATIVRARDRNRHVPIIFLTAYDRDQSEVLRAYELGAVDFLFKPIQPVVLRSKIGVFVELQRRAAEVARQAERVRELERREHQQAMAVQRQELEAIAANREIEEQRRSAERLAEIDRRKDEFLAMLGHELRTPLAAIAAGLELGAASDISEGARARTREMLSRQISHVIRLVDDLLDVSRIGSGRIRLQRAPALLNQLIEHAVELARPAITCAQHSMVVDLPDRPVMLDVDPTRIVQAISNLINNAARYTDPRGAISISARVYDERRALISVEDNGRGICPDRLESVFDVFTRDAADGQGLGLGLPLARRLVELHGGSLVAHSEGLGRGARFDIELPLPRVADELAHRTAQPARDAPTRRPQRPCHVLLVEDDDDLRHTLYELLSIWGHEVHAASCGEAGLEELLSNPPDVALIDIGLPDLDGCVLVERARAKGSSSTRFIALTGFTQPADRRRIDEAGFDELLDKPPNLDQLHELLGECARRPL